MKTYCGTPDGLVTVEDESGRERRLPLEPSWRVRQHSPTGFSWGYNGSGPAQLALAILLDHFGVQREAELRYQRFKSAVIAKFVIDQPWRLTSHDIDVALREIDRTEEMDQAALQELRQMQDGFVFPERTTSLIDRKEKNGESEPD